jgi:hypothetical protein
LLIGGAAERAEIASGWLEIAADPARIFFSQFVPPDLISQVERSDSPNQWSSNQFC